jgi:pilus assembly protein CpaB
MVLIVIALVCGLIASIGISQVVEKNSAKNNQQLQTKPIFVAITDLGIGAELDAKSVKLEEWPLDKVPPGAITEAKQLDGKSPNQRLYAGEPLLLAKLSDANSLRGMHVAETIRKGYRVMSVKVDMASAVSGLIHPGDRVDVLAVDGPRTNAEVILTNIEVFAINDKTTIEVDDAEGEANRGELAKTVSLLVTSDQARKLMANSYKSTISLSLRRPDDETGMETSLAETLGQMVAPQPPVAITPPAMPKLPAMVAAPREQYFMEVLEGGATSGIRRYAFDDRESLPREISSSDDNGNPTSPSNDFPFPQGGSAEGTPGGQPVQQGPPPASARTSLRETQ